MFFYLKESMAGCVQDFMTIRVGSMWIDIPMGPLVTNSFESLGTTATSPMVLNNEQEINSKPKEEFTLLCPKLQSRRLEGLLQRKGWRVKRAH